MTSLDSIFKSRDITLPTKVRLVKAMVFPVEVFPSQTSFIPSVMMPFLMRFSMHRTASCLFLLRGF